MATNTFIYALVDPRDLRVRYVGKSHDPDNRLRYHMMCHTNNAHLNSWLSQLIRAGLQPLVRIIEECPVSKWKQRERFWISSFRQRGVRLTNKADGGQGFAKGYRPSQETRRKMRESHWSRRGIKPASYLADDVLLDRLRKKAEELGRAPVTSELGNRYITILRRFGTWNKALMRAGISPETKPTVRPDVLEARRQAGIYNGSNNGRSKLTEKQVLAIRDEYARGGSSCSALAKKYPVCQQMISRIIRREAWTHVRD